MHVVGDSLPSHLRQDRAYPGASWQKEEAVGTQSCGVLALMLAPCIAPRMLCGRHLGASCLNPMWIPDAVAPRLAVYVRMTRAT